MQKGKMVVRVGLKIAMNRRGVKGKGEKERYTHLNAEFQRIARRGKKPFLNEHFYLYLKVSKLFTKI